MKNKVKRFKKYVMLVLEVERKENMTEKIFEDVMLKKFQN